MAALGQKSGLRSSEDVFQNFHEGGMSPDPLGIAANGCVCVWGGGGGGGNRGSLPQAPNVRGPLNSAGLIRFVSQIPV